MSRRSLLMILSVIACLVAPSASRAGWSVVFDDQFEGHVLDRTNWATRYIFANETLDALAGEQEAYSDHGNHIVGGGLLRLVAKKAPAGSRQPYQSGMVRSLRTFYYGYFEARVKMPVGVGTWPAFWLGSDFDADGYATHPPEIDVFDNANNGRDSTLFTTTSGTLDGNTKAQGGAYVYTDPNYDEKHSLLTSPKDSNANWHVFGLLWTPTEATVWRDGRRLYTKTYKWVTDDGKLAPPAHILFTLAVGGPWAGKFGIDGGRLPQSFLIDYIRVCQLSKEPAETGQPCKAGPFTPILANNDYVSNAPGGGDALRPILTPARLGKTTFRPGELIHLREVVHSPISTAERHSVFFYLVGQARQTVALSRVEPTPPTTDWADKTIPIDADLSLPARTPPGRYDLYMAAGTPRPWDPGASNDLRAMTFAYDPAVTDRMRLGQPLRYRIGSLEVFNH